MTEEDVRQFFVALGSGDMEPLAERLHEEVVLHFPGRRFGGTFAGRRRVMVFLKQNQRLFRDGLQFDVHWVGTTGDRAVACWTNHGVTRSGKEYSNWGTTVFVVGDDQIVEIHDYLDTERIAETWPSKS